MKIIAFSLWGDNKLYCQGAIDNIACAKEHYPDWICRFYVDTACPALPVLEKMNCQVIPLEQNYNAIDRTKEAKEWTWDYANTGMLWRFDAIEDKDVDRVVFRDTDSRVGARDAQAVKEWERSGMLAHRMHECKEHWNAQAMGGMWGICGRAFKGIHESIVDYVKNIYPARNEPWIFVDLWYIMDILWPYIKDSCMGHGFGHPNPFVIDGPMVGSVVNEEWREQKYVQ